MHASVRKLRASSTAVRVVALLALTLAGMVSLAPVPANAAEFSNEVGQPLKDAQAAMSKRNWDSALASIKKAQSVPTRKPAEDHAINEMLAYVLISQKKPAEAARVYEQSIDAGLTPQAKVPERQKTIAQLYAQASYYPKAIDYGNRYLKTNSADADMHWLVAQAEYQSKDCPSALLATDNAIRAARRANQSPKLDWLRMKLVCQPKEDKRGIRDTREQMVRHFPTKQNWNDLLGTLCRSDDVHDRAKLDCYRLMLETDTLKEPDVYVEMAQIALESGMPGEAVRILEKGFSNGVLADKNKDRHTRLLNQAKEQARAIESNLAKLTAEATADSKGGGDLQLAGAYMSVGKYDKAVESIQRSIKKGGIKHVDAAQMMLGRAYLKLNQKEQARKAFKSVADDSQLSRVAGLWNVYAQQS